MASFLTEAETIRYLNERAAGSEIVFFTDPPTKAGTDGTELTGGGAGRVAVPFAPATAGTAGRTGQIANDSPFTIENMPVDSTQVVGFALADAVSGDLWFVNDSWTPTEAFAAGGTMSVAAGALVIYGEN